jgi:hypothetical protein
MGMDREKFRKMVIGLVGLTFIIFLAIIVLFSKRASYPQPKFPDIFVAQPKSGDKIGMPLLITGQAQEHWFFEKAFPLTIYDKNNLPVAHGYAQALSDQPLSSASLLIPFQAFIDGYDFPPQSKKGYLVAQRGTGFDDKVIEDPGVISIPIIFGKEGKDRIVTPTGVTGTNNGNGLIPNNSGDPNGSGIAVFQCSDDTDNDNDGLVDSKDPDCHIDGNAQNTNSYDTLSNESGRFGVGDDFFGYGNSNGVPSGNTGSTGNTSPGPTDINGFSGTHNGSVTIYWPNSADNPLNPGCDKLFPVQRNVGEGSMASVVQKTAQVLGDGPDYSEAGSGYTTPLKSGLNVDRVTLSSAGTLSIYFHQSSITGSVPWCSKTQAKKAVTQTMKQFADVETVKIYANNVLQ